MTVMQHATTLFRRQSEEGVTGALPKTQIVDYCILAACSAVAWAYAIELDLLILYTFRRRKGLYFWSLLICSWGLSLHAIGFTLKFLVGTPPGVDLPFIEVGWTCMVTGQAFVLFSRLHLVVRNRRTLRLVLAMIIFDALALHVPTIIFTCGANSASATFWVPKFNIMERIQLTGFCIQEFIISTIYIVATVRLLGSIYHSMTRKVMMQLLVINFICIGMDIILIVLEFTNVYVGEASIKPLIYAIKLKLEFAVLNQLMGLTKAGFTEESQFQNGAGTGGPGGHHELAASRSAGGTVTTAVDPEAGNMSIAGASGKKHSATSSAWASARAMGGSFSHHFHHHHNQHNNAVNNTAMGPGGIGGADPTTDTIFQTKQVDVTTSPKSPSNGNVSDTSTSSTVVGSTASNNPLAKGASPHTGSGAKASSLMGTAIVRMPSSDLVHNRPAGRIGGGANSRSQHYAAAAPTARRNPSPSHSGAMGLGLDPEGRAHSPLSEGETGILDGSDIGTAHGGAGLMSMGMGADRGRGRMEDGQMDLQHALSLSRSSSETSDEKAGEGWIEGLR